MSAELRELQRWFAGAVRGPRHAGPCGVRPRVVDATACARLHVYADAYEARLVEVLASDFPAVRARLGVTRFDALARRYVRAHPSRHPNLIRFGARFPAFLARTPGTSAFVRDLARLEAATTRAFDAPPAATLVGAELAALEPAAWSRARFTVSPAVQLLRVPAAVADWLGAWRATQPERGPLPRRRGVVDVVVARRGDRVVQREQPAAAARVLRALRAGRTLARALASTRDAGGLAGWFAAWREDEVFTAVRT